MKEKQEEPDVITYAGNGEPTLHPDLLKIIKYGKKIGYDKIQVITNGRMFCYLNFIKQVKDAGLDEITFSIHGHNARMHDFLTGIRGSFKQTVAGLKNALAMDFIVNVDIVVNKQNYKHLLEIIKYLNFLGVNEFDLLTIMPYGRAWEKNFNKLFYNLLDLQKIFQQILDFAHKRRIILWYNRFPVNFFEGREELIGDISKKLEQEVFSEQQGLFENYLYHGQMMACHNPKRCPHCFLCDFCAQLIEINRKIRNKKYLANIFKEPYCISQDNFRKINLEKLHEKGALNLKKFFDFYLNNLHQYKSIRCQDCSANYKCRGLDFARIKKYGFKILKPIIK
jgi:MoaA/NifB/PqqE/SkfB family radical SAM enzyme